MAKAIPDGYSALTPVIFIDGCKDAIDWYKKALGAEEIMIMPGPDGKIMHAELKIAGSMIMMSDSNEQFGTRSPKGDEKRTSSLWLYVEDVDASFKQAIDAGATEISPVMDMFWGDRCGNFVDPFGHHWGLATHTQDLTPEEIMKGQEEWMASMAGA